MENIQVPFYALDGNQVAAQNDAALLRKLSEFCLAQLQRLKMVTSTFSHEFQLRAGQRERSKGAAKLARVLTRNIVKQAPYLANALTAASGGALVDSETDSLSIEACIYDFESARVLSRYCRLLNYVFRKSKFPALVTTNYSESHASEGLVIVSVRLYMVASCPQALSPLSSEEAYAVWLAGARDAKTASGLHPDSVYADDTLWRTYDPLTWHRDSLAARTRSAGMPSLGVFERVFLHLPEIMRVIQTISRKFAYASNAFTIRAGEST